MLPRLHWADITTIGHYLGVLIVLTGALMVPPALVALVLGEADSLSAFVLGIGVCGLCGSLLCLLRAYRFDRRRSLIVLGLGWVVVALAASVPLYASGEYSSYVNALFDAVSAVTTTGISLADDVDHMAVSQVVWHTLLALGGAAAVIVAAVALHFFGEGGEVLAQEKRGGTGGTRSVILKSLRLIVIVFGTFTLVGTLIVFCMGLASGTGPVTALAEAFTLVGNALATCSFTPHSSGLIYYHSLGLYAVIGVCMLLGALNFAVFALCMRGGWRAVRADVELRLYLGIMLVLDVLVTVSLAGTVCGQNVASLFVNGVMPLVSAATTAGMQSIYPEQFGTAIEESALLILCVALLFGACSHSSGGGIKTIRLVTVIRWMGYSIRSIVLPQQARVRVRYEHFGLKRMDAQLATSAMIVTALYIVSAALGTMLFIAHGNDSIQSVFEAVSYVSNGGMTSGLSSPDMALDLKVAAMLLMWMGRVEFIAVFAVIGVVCVALRPGNVSRPRSAHGAVEGTGGGLAWKRRKSQPRATRPGRSACTVLAVGVAVALAITLVARPYALAASDLSEEAQVPASSIETLGDGETYRELTVAELLGATERLEGKSVQFEGEVVGVPVRADESHVWLNIKSDDAMVGVYVTASLVEDVDGYGSYAQTGDTVQIRGTYHLACEEHAGELEVHAYAVSVVDEGQALEHAFSARMLVAGGVLFAAGLLVTLVRTGSRRWGSKRSRRSIWR